MFLNMYLILFTHVASRTKSKGLPIDVPYHLIHFIRVELIDPD
jgi:hypothetical protein